MAAQGRPHRRDLTLDTGCCGRSDGREEPNLSDAALRLKVRIADRKLAEKCWAIIARLKPSTGVDVISTGSQVMTVFFVFILYLCVLNTVMGIYNAYISDRGG